MADLAGATISSAFALMGLSFAVIIARLVLRRFKYEQWMLDDYILIFAILLYAIDTATYPVVVSTDPLVEYLRAPAKVCIQGSQWYQRQPLQHFEHYSRSQCLGNHQRDLHQLIDFIAGRS